MAAPGVFPTARLRQVAARCEALFADGNDACHDWQHVLRVYALGCRLAEMEGADPELVGAAALVHDLGHYVNGGEGDHAATAGDVQLRILQEAGFAAAECDAVLHAARVHRYSTGGNPATLEAEVLRDADKLDALGAIGVARCFAYGTVLGAGLYDPDDPFCEGKASCKDDRFSVDHFYAKLLCLQEVLHTDSARRVAAGRTAFLHSFLSQLRVELEETFGDPDQSGRPEAETPG